MNLTRRTAAWLAFALALPVYLATMNRTVGFIDRGELAAAAWTFGIPHATGYPTLMLLGGAVARLLPLRPVLALNLFAAVLVAAGVAVLVLLHHRVLERLGAGDDPAPVRRAWLALGSALATAFTLTWWQQANGFEVYALHALMMPLVTLLGLRWLDAADAEDAEVGRPGLSATKAGLAFGLAAGLSFTNHGTTLLLVPGLLAAAVARLGAGRRLLRHALPLAPGFLLGLLPYAWLPLRSAMRPALDWGGTSTWRGFLHHVTGGDYRGWMFTGPDDFLTQLAFVAGRLPWDWAWIGLLPVALGAFALARRARDLALLAAGCVVAGVTFASGYRILDLDSYLLTPVFGLSILLVAGLARLAGRFHPRAALATAGLLLALNVALHTRECDESGNRMGEQVTLDQIGPMPRGSLFVTSLWDFGQSAALYLQLVEGVRRDVVIVNPELARLGWYVEALVRRSPELTGRIPAETSRLRRALRAAESGRPFDGAEAEAAYRGFLRALVASAMEDRAVFVSGRFDWLPRGTSAVPWHLAYRVWPEAGGYLGESGWEFRLRPWTGRTDAYLAMVTWLYGDRRLERARYEARHGNEALARVTLASAARFDPRFRLDRVGVLPLAGQELVARSARFYATLDRTLDVAGSDAR